MSLHTLLLSNIVGISVTNKKKWNQSTKSDLETTKVLGLQRLKRIDYNEPGKINFPLYGLILKQTHLRRALTRMLCITGRPWNGPDLTKQYIIWSLNIL